VTEPGDLGKKLDFIIIGAGKSGTTTLHELLKSHPQLTVPEMKEVPYFSDDRVYEKGMTRYLDTWFKAADKNSLWGTITPHYMLGQGETNPEVIAQRIHDELPDCRLVAILRHPVERAFSLYKMSVQRGFETRSFEDVVGQVLAAPDQTRAAVDPDHDYVFGSEYGRILGYYYNFFPAEHILILTTDELHRDAAGTVRTICTFLGIDASYQPANLGAWQRRGGSKPRLRILTPGFLYKFPLVKRLWKSAVPQVLRKRVEYTVNLWNSQPDNVTLDPSGQAYQSLIEFYRDDVGKLESLTAQVMPWPEWHRAQQASVADR
jgi:hypothetical protein